MPEIVAIITARGGSKGLPRKNLALVAGKSLLARAVEAARGCSLIEAVYVTTEDGEIAAAAAASGARVIPRPAHLASDEASSSDAVAHALEVIRHQTGLPAYFVLLQPTSPFRTADHVTRCLEGFLASHAACALSVCESEHHPFKSFVREDHRLRPLVDAASLEAPRQQLPAAYRPNGAIYAMSAEAFLQHRRFFIEPVYTFEMGPAESLDIDTPHDLAVAEVLACTGGPARAARIEFPGAVRKYGKPFDAKNLRRTLDWRLRTAADQRAVARRYAPARIAPLPACPICGDRRRAPFVTVYGYDFCQCADCGDIYMLTPPDPASVARLYTGDAADKSIQGAIYLDDEIFLRRVAQIARPKAGFVAGMVPGRGVWVDVGCGSGEMLMAAGELGFEALGIEADPDSVAFARRRGFRVFEGFVPSPELDAVFRGAAVVSLVNVLEHVADPVGLVESICRHLGAGATVVFEVPRHPSLSSLSNLFFPDLSYRHIYPPDHLNIFTEKAVGILIARCGLTARGVWTFGQDFHELVAGASLHAGFQENALLDAVFDAAAAVQQTIDEQGLSDALLMVASKP